VAVVALHGPKAMCNHRGMHRESSWTIELRRREAVTGAEGEGSNPLVMPSVWSERAWALGIGAGALVLGTAILNLPKVLPESAGLLAPLAAALATIPLWLVLLGTFLSTLGIVYLIQTARSVMQSKHRQAEPLKALRPVDIEVDLHSIFSLVALFSTTVPEISILLRVTNHSPYDITVNTLKVSVWFNQPTTELTLDAPFEVKAHSTRDTVSLRKLLDGSIAAIVSEFFDSDNWSKFIAIDIIMSGTSDAGPFTRSPHFELRGHDLKGVQR